MGNSLGGKKTAKVMKIDGETLKIKTPMTAEEVLKEYPGLVLLDSEAVKHYGVRAKPLQAGQRLEAKRLYFLVEPPRQREGIPPRRVRSGIHMSAQERLESLVLARRSASDLSILNPSGRRTEAETAAAGSVRVKVRVPKAEIERLVRESATEAEAAEKIVGLFVAKQRDQDARDSTRRLGGGVKAREKRVSFMAPREAGKEISVAS
ncbi:PREDICTED: uncharacterized protein At1g66480 isoform X1 [Tarenaya hassleriana]|uniref:uncharacterized protein At1g66480 isoform X1 n=1 Tax=Tarenaya hassleriana TaxID=28532 RepID=UPI00053C88A3|nr:PREDICTED: uncharacterized protein At1g66480 isoform X1 [Tarenaya hassleriana]